MSQHEQATEVAVLASDADYPAELDRGYIALYRRVLKWILEQACDIKLHNKEISNMEFLKRAKSLLNELMFLGDMIFTCANIYAEQDMIEDVAEIIFDEENQYVINHKHHYNYIIQEINKVFKNQSYKYVVDEMGCQICMKLLIIVLEFNMQYSQLLFKKFIELICPKEVNIVDLTGRLFL